jgi:RNA polymerase sigma factor (sigma-70 family)
MSDRRLRSVVSSLKTQTGWSIAEEGDSDSLEESVIDPRRPDQEMEKAEADAELRRAIRSLTRLEARVINCRFGLDSRPSRSARRGRVAKGGAGMPPLMKFNDVSRVLGISAVRVRKVLRRALDKLRAGLADTLGEDDPLPGRPAPAAGRPSLIA